MLQSPVLKLPLACNLLRIVCPAATNINIRHGHQLRGKPPGVARTIEQRLQAIKEGEATFVEEKKPVNIGFPPFRLGRSEETKQKIEHRRRQKSDTEFERLARRKELNVDLDKAKSDWLSTDGQFQIKNIATHFGIYEHLFGYAYFVPRVPLDIKYRVSDDEYAVVHYGNTLKPTHAKTEPEVSFDPNVKLLENQAKDSLWTLVLTNPDSHFTQNDKEYVHWFIGNIPNGDVSKGDVVVPYLQPFPPKGTGYHRHIFVLYKQDKKMNFDDYKVEKINDLDKRTFKTLDFYRKYQDDITPAGLAFFQSDWDTNVTEVYHNVLNMKEPSFEYDFPRPYHKKETYFPLRQAFNLYLDRYRDQKQINKEFLERELKKTHPFDGPEPKLRFPGAHPLKNMPQWLITEKKKSRHGWGRINDLKEEFRT